VDATSGQRVWRFDATRKIRGTVVLDGDRVIVGTFGAVVYAVNRRDGTKLWERNTQGPIVTSVALISGRVVVGNRNGVLAALDVATGQPIWRVQLWGSSAESEAVPAGGTNFYFGSSDLRRVSLIDVTDGRVLWRTDVLGWAWPRPVVLEENLVVSTVGATPYQMRHLGGLTVLDRSTGSIRFRWSMPVTPGTWSHGFFAPAAVAGRMIVIGGLDGSLYGFQLPGR
jgi:outer membrane protein assembly factor BamB